MKNILIAMVLCVSLVFPLFAGNYYNQEKVEIYKQYIEEKAGELIQEKTFSERIELHRVVSQMLYKNNQTVEDIDYKHLLYALRENLGENLGQKQGSFSLRIIDDVRCTQCHTSELLEEYYSQDYEFIRQEADIIYQDFAQQGVPEYLREHNIDTLPVLIFNTNFEDSDYPGQENIAPYMYPLSDGNYIAFINSNFNPFEFRSARGFQVLDKKLLKKIQDDGYILGNSKAEITWLEYADMECVYCAKLHNSGVLEALQNKYGTQINYLFQHFPIFTHSQEGAEIFECVAEQNEDVVYDLLSDSFKHSGTAGFSLTYLYDAAESADIDRIALNQCVESKKYTDKVQAQMTQGQEIFDITGVPANIIINNITGEYIIIPGAYGYETFEEAVESLLTEK